MRFVNIMEEGCETMFILLFPMGMGILAWIFGLRQIMRAVSDQRMVCRFDQRMQQWMKDGGIEEKWSKEALGLIPIMPLVKKGMIIGLLAGVVMDIITYVAAQPLVQISRRAGGAAGVLAFQNGSIPLRVALSLWGHGSLAAGIIAFMRLAVGTAMAVCGVVVKTKVSADLERAYKIYKHLLNVHND